MRFEEPEVNGAGLILVACTFALLMAAIAFGAWAYFRATEIESPVATHMVSEGEAKAALIKQLTGHIVSPEHAIYVNINLTGTTVAIETHSINLFDGKKWRDLQR